MTTGNSFQEVVKHWKRLCSSLQNDQLSCMEKCPLASNPVCGELYRATSKDIEKFEYTVMKWAEDHPEPVYPTWWEWLSENGIVPQKVDPDTAFKIFKEDGCCSGLVEQIPSEIAEKIGVLPKKMERWRGDFVNA